MDLTINALNEELSRRGIEIRPIVIIHRRWKDAWSVDSYGRLHVGANNELKARYCIERYVYPAIGRRWSDY